jgi:hypothetical protein
MIVGMSPAGSAFRIPIARRRIMAVIDRISPGSIQTVKDMVHALELVIRDSFRDVLDPAGRTGDVLEFEVQDHEVALSLGINVFDRAPIDDQTSE